MNTVDSVQPEVSFSNVVQVNLVFDNGVPAAGLYVSIYSVGFGGNDTLLGTATPTSPSSSYVLTYNPATTPVNLQVRVLASTKSEVTISKTKYNAQTQETLNLVVPASILPLGAEYDRLAADMTTYIGGVGSLANTQETAVRQDLSLLNQTTNWDARPVALLATAVTHPAAAYLGQDVIYALTRMGLPTDSGQLASIPWPTVQAALTKASQAGLVNIQAAQISSLQTTFAYWISTALPVTGAPGAVSNLGALLPPSGGTDFLNLYVNNPAGGAEFWNQVGALQNPGLSVPALQLQGKFLYLTYNNAPLTAKLQQDVGSLDKLSQLAALDYHLPATWTAAITALAGASGNTSALIPSFYAVQSADPLTAYAADMARQVRISFPEAVMAREIETGKLGGVFASAAIQTSTAAFLRAAEGIGYQLGNTPLNAFLKNYPANLPQLDSDGVAALLTLHRLSPITPNIESLQAALTLGFTSARDIASYGKDDFMTRFSASFPSAVEASLVYGRAQMVSAVTFNYAVMAKQLDTGVPVFALSGSSSDRQSAKSALVQQLPSLSTLFGNMDFCQCDDCRSVLSPAAYFVDLLQFLGGPVASSGNANANGYQPLDVLIGSGDGVIGGRRPDLGALPLSCENTNTAMPYIDLVNEIFEYYILNSHLDANAAYDTGASTTADLIAEPQHILPAVYSSILNKAVYPLNLPFDLWIETVRGFLNYFKIPLQQVLDAFRPADTLELFTDAGHYPYYLAQILSESLGISPAEYGVLTATDLVTRQPSVQNWFALYGYADEATALSELSSAKTLAQQLGLTYQEVTDLVETGFLNPGLYPLIFQFQRFGIEMSDAFIYTGQPGYPIPTGWDAGAFNNLLAGIQSSYLSQNPSSGFVAATWLTGLLPANYTKSVLVLADPVSGCDFGSTTVRYADGSPATALDYLKFNLFVRLWKKLGWSLDEIDRAMQLFFPANLPAWGDPTFATAFNSCWKTALVYLAHLDDLNTRLSPALGRIALLPLWANLPVQGEDPLYAQLFLTFSVLNHDWAFDDPRGVFPTALADFGAAPQAGAALSTHQAAIQGVLGLSADEITAILADAGAAVVTVPSVAGGSAVMPGFTLGNLSICYRYSALAKCLQLSVLDLIALKGLSGLNPFSNIAPTALSVLADDVLYGQTLQFIKEVTAVQNSAFTVEDLQYLLRQQFDPVGKYQTDPNAMTELMQTLAAGLQQIEAQNSVPGNLDSLSESLLDQILSGLFPATILTKLFALLGNAQAYTAQLSLPAAFDGSAFPPQDGLSFDYEMTQGIETFTFAGLLLNWQMTELNALNPATNPAINTVLSELQQDAQTSLAQSVGDLLGVWASLVQYESVQIPVATAIANPELLEQADPALSLSYDQTDQLQWLGYRGVLTDAKLNTLKSIDSSAVLQALMGDVQGQAMPAYKQLIGSLLAMWTNAQTYVSTQPSPTAIDPVAFFQALATARQNLTITEPVPQLQFSYSSAMQTVSCVGMLTDNLRTQLTALSAGSILGALLQDIRNQVVTTFEFLATGLVTVLPAEIDPFALTFIGTGAALQQRQIKAQLVQAFLPLLTYKLSRQLVVQTLSSDLDADATLTEALITDAALLSDPGNVGKSLLGSFTGVGGQGLTASYYNSTDCTGVANASGVAATADTADATNSQPGTASARFEGYLQVATDGPYRFSAEFGNAGAVALLQLDSPNQSALFNNPILGPAVASQFVELQGGVAYHFSIEFHTLGAGGARLLVQGETLPKGALSQIGLYPQQAFVALSRAKTLLGKVIQILQTTGVGIREFSYFMSDAAQFANLKLSALPTQTSDDSPANAVSLFAQLLALIDYADLRQGPAGNSDTLIDVFEAAAQSLPQEPNTPWTILANLTRRDPQVVQAVAAALGPQPHFENAPGIRRLWEALQMVQTIGIPVASLAASTLIVGAAPLLTPAPDQVAASFKSAVQAQFTADTWRPVAQSVFDPLRQKKRDALVAYLVQALSLENSNQLFEYFLVDPGMEPVVQTSRLRLALSSVQTFVQRCLLSLEDGNTNAALNVAPSAINADLWEWMKRYRVWQASREIFLFPENWMEPELRPDKTDLFQDLESSLLQGDITSDLVEDAFFTYLQGLDVRARLDIVATYLDQNLVLPQLSTLHVLGRTYGHPHKYFYRTWTGGMWSAWEAVTFDIESDHIVLAFWKGRLNVFWVTFLSKPQAVQSSAVSFGDLNNTAIASTQAQQAVQLQLHWCEYFQGKWSTRISSDINKYPAVLVADDFDPKSVYIHVSKETNTDGSDGAVRIHLDFQVYVWNVAAYADVLYSGVAGPVTTTLGDEASHQVGLGHTETVGHSFRVTSKNCNPDLSSVYWQQGVSQPYDASAVDATAHAGGGSLNVYFESQIASDGSGSQDVEQILLDGNSFEVLTCANPVAPSSLLNPSEPLYWQAGTLSAPFFYKDTANAFTSEELTFFVQPALTEWTMLSWEGWAVAPPLATEDWTNPNVVSNIPVAPQVPAAGPFQGIIPDPVYSNHPMQASVDWITSPQTVVSFGGTLIGQTGGINLTQGAPLQTPVAARGLNVVGKQGLNVRRISAVKVK